MIFRNAHAHSITVGGDTYTFIDETPDVIRGWEWLLDFLYNHTICFRLNEDFRYDPFLLVELPETSYISVHGVDSFLMDYPLPDGHWRTGQFTSQELSEFLTLPPNHPLCKEKNHD